MESAIPNKYQTFWLRLVAGIIDVIVFVPFGIIQGILMENSSMRDEILADILFTLCWTVYVVIGHGRYGQTVGKKLMYIKVLDISEDNLIGYKRSFLRESVSFFMSMGVSIYFLERVGDLTKEEAMASYNYGFGLYIGLAWFIIEILTTLTNKKYRAVHDYIAGSVVVRIPPKPTPVEELFKAE